MDLLAQENKILKQTLQDIIDIDQGMYPKSIQGSEKNDYKKRTPYMDGWNDSMIEQMEEICKVLNKNSVEILDDRVDVNI